MYIYIYIQDTQNKGCRSCPLDNRAKIHTNTLAVLNASTGTYAGNMGTINSGRHTMNICETLAVKSHDRPYSTSAPGMTGLQTATLG